ncbi:hypothetical protein Tco_0396725, partial [Tanacetum coccineum]
SISGVKTIRCFRKHDRYVQENVERVNGNLRMDFHNNGSNGWLELKDLQVIIDNFPKSDMLELKIFCNRWMRHSIQQKSFLGLLFCPLEVVNEAHDQCMEEKKAVVGQRIDPTHYL